MKKNGTRAWPWHAGTALLALVFAQPACFTMNTWRDDRSNEVLHEAKTPRVRAFRLANDRGAIALQLPEDRAAYLHGVLPTIPATAGWIVVEPQEYEQTAALLLAVACAKGVDRTRDIPFHGDDLPYARVDLRLVDDPSRDALEWRLVWSQFMGSPLNDAIPRLPGFTKYTMIYTSYHYGVVCKVTATPTEPRDLAEPIPAFTFTHERIRDDGTPLVTRLLVTPLAVLGDLLLSPFELLWLLSP